MILDESLFESVNEQNILKAVKEKFQASNYPVPGPTYILPDGSFLDITESFDPKNSYEDFPCHAEVEAWLIDHDLSLFPYDMMSGSPTLESLGAIRCNDLSDNNFIQLSKIRPTSSQYDSLEDWVYENTSHRSELIVATPEFEQYKKYDPEDVDYIIKRIKRYYASSTLYENLQVIEYRPIFDIDRFKKYADEILGGYGGMSDSDIKRDVEEIYIDGELKGYIGLSKYNEEDGTKLLGIGNFMILERGKGYGTQVINDIVSRYKNEFDLIYCFVDADNTGAISLYKKLGKVYDKDGPNDNGQYYVTFYDNGKYKLEENLTEAKKKRKKKKISQVNPGEAIFKSVKDMQKWVKKRQKGMGYFVHMDCGNMDYNNDMFNKMHGLGDASSNSTIDGGASDAAPSGGEASVGMGESLEMNEDVVKLSPNLIQFMKEHKNLINEKDWDALFLDYAEDELSEEDQSQLVQALISIGCDIEVIE